MEIKTTHFLVALVAATAIHLVLFPLISETKPPPKKAPTEVVLIDLAALGEPDAPEAPPAAAQEPLPAPEAAPAVQAPLPEPEVQPEPTPEPEPEPVTQPEPEPEPEPVIAPEPEPEPVAQPEPELEPEPAPPPRPLPKPVPKPTPPKPEPPKPQPAPPPPAPQQPAPPRPAPPRPAVEQSRPAPPTVERPRPRKGIKTGVPQGTAKAAKTALNRYITEIYHLIEAKKVYPSRSLRRREQGTVIVRLTLAADGSLIKVAAAAGGPKRLVEASLKAVRRAAPFPPFPKTMKMQQAVFQVPVAYRLR